MPTAGLDCGSPLRHSPAVQADDNTRGEPEGKRTSLPRRVLARVFAVLMGLLIPLLAVELGMRALGAGKPKGLGFAFDRSTCRYYPDEARQNPWTRGETNVLRVAVIGDSISNGAGIQCTDTFALRLEQLLNMNPGMRPAEVRLYAKGGTSTYTQLPFLDEALKQKPDVIVLGICLNDTEDWGRRKELGRWRDELLPTVPGPRLAAALKHSRALDWMYRRLQDMKCNRAVLLHYERLFDPAYSGWARFVAALKEFQERSREHGATLVAAVFPEMSRLDQYPYDYCHARIRKALESEGIRHLDLLGEYKGKSPFRLQAVPQVDSHPNEIGHRIAAEAIFEYLLANKIVDPGYLPVHKTGSADLFWRRVADRMQNPAGERERNDNVDPTIMVK
jgi:lysophospholipase L1-like esterase